MINIRFQFIAHILPYSRNLFSLLLLLFLLIAMIFQPAEIRALSIETGFHYSREVNKTDPSTTYISAPLRISGQPLKSLSLEMTIPYIYQKNSHVAAIGSRSSEYFPSGSTSSKVDEGSQQSYPGQHGPSASNNGQQGPPPSIIASSNSGKGYGPGNLPHSFTPGKGQEVNTNKKQGTLLIKSIDSNSPLSESPNESESGLGDICLLWSYSFYDFFRQFPPYVPTLDISGGIKFPTADSDPNNGLGTGEFDYTLGFTFNWDIGMVTGYIYGDYTWVGDTDETDFRNISCFGCGTDIYLSPKTTLLVGFSGSTPLYEGNSCPLSLSVGAKRKFLNRYWIHGYGLAGLNEENTDYGCGISVSTVF